MKTLKNIFLLISLISFVSCEENLTFKDYNKMPQAEFWQTKTHAEQALTAIYGSFSSDRAYYDPTVLGPEQMASDETSKGSTAGSQADLNSFIDFSFTPALARFDNLWKSRYGTINLCNQVIEYVPNINMAEADKKQIIGEAKFIRAYLYFELTRLFGEVIIYDGLPKGNVYDIPKSSVEDVYALILTDLKYGYENMRKTAWDNTWKGRVTAWAARALESKVLMYMASGNLFMENGQAIGGKTWNDVKTVTNDVITNGIYNLFTAKGDSSFFYLYRLENENCVESIFESQNSVSNTTTSVNTSAYALNAWIKSGRDGGFGYSVPSDTLVAVWKKRYNEQNDKRYKYSVIFKGEIQSDGDVADGAAAVDGITGTPRYNYKVFVPKNQRSPLKGGGWIKQFEQNQRFLRFAEVLLIDAEAKVRTNDLAGAMISINKIRKRAGEPEFTQTSQVTLQAVLDERRFELAFENDRYFDLIRTGQASTVLAYKGWKSPKNIFYPIPQTQIDLSNKILTQNKYW